MQPLDRAGSLAVKLNGKTLTNGVKTGVKSTAKKPGDDEGWLQFSVDPNWVKKGINTFEFTLDGSATQAVELTDLLLIARYAAHR